MKIPPRYLLVGLAAAWAARALGAQAREDSVALAREVLRTRLRSAQAARARDAAGAWRTVVQTADSFQVRFGPLMEFWIPRGIAAIRLAEWQVEAAQRGRSCAAAKRAQAAVGDAQVGLPASFKFPLPDLDPMLPRLITASQTADALVRRWCQ